MTTVTRRWLAFADDRDLVATRRTLLAVIENLSRDAVNGVESAR